MIRKPWSYINQQASLTRGFTRDSYFSLQITQVLMFPVNTIIAWYVNIYHKYEDMIITYFIIASWAYLQQSPTCTRVNNLVSDLCVFNTYGFPVLYVHDC